MGRLVLLTMVVWAAASAASAAGHQRTSREWGFSLAFPKSLDVCVNGSWHQAHGWGASLAGTCSKPRTNRAIIVVANGSFLTKPEEATGCAKPEVSAGAKLGLSFDGRISATCRENLPEPEGTILITVVTQVDVEDAADHSQPGDAAIDYEAELTTTPAKLKDDLVTFRRVLRSVQIDRPPPTLVR